MTIKEAKEFLESKGYVTGTLWHVDDVMSKYVCDSEEAREIIELAETVNIATIYEDIYIIALERNLQKQPEQ